MPTSRRNEVTVLEHVQQHFVDTLVVAASAYTNAGAPLGVKGLIWTEYSINFLSKQGVKRESEKNPLDRSQGIQ